MPLASKVRNSPFSVAQGSGCGVHPYSTKLVLPVLRRGKKVLVGELRICTRMPTCVSIAAAAWHTASRYPTLTQSSVTPKPLG